MTILWPLVHFITVNHFNVTLKVSEVNKALKSLDSKKLAGPDKLAPHFLKLAADFIVPPLTYICNFLHLQMTLILSGKQLMFGHKLNGMIQLH